MRAHAQEDKLAPPEGSFLDQRDAQLVKAPAVKPDDLSSIPGARRGVGGELDPASCSLVSKCTL